MKIYKYGISNQERVKNPITKSMKYYPVYFDDRFPELLKEFRSQPKIEDPVEAELNKASIPKIHYEIPPEVRLENKITIRHDTSGYFNVHPANEGRRSKFEQFVAKFIGLKSGWSDILILKPNKKYHGLIIELKADGITVFKKNGELRKNKTLKNQYDFICKCRKDGYYACFAIGSTEAINIINKYLNNKL